MRNRPYAIVLQRNSNVASVDTRSTLDEAYKVGVELALAESISPRLHAAVEEGLRRDGEFAHRSFTITITPVASVGG